MPLRDDLLDPIPGENPSGEDLYYARIFDLIKEARREELDDLPEGDWGRAQKKKADYPQVRKLAGEALAKRSKDLRLVSWLVDAEFKLEGIDSLVPCLELVLAIQENFWETLYPVIEEGDDVELRAIAAQSVIKELSLELKKTPLTAKGLDSELYLESRIVGYEKDQTTDAKQEARKKAIDSGKICAEDFDRAVAATPKAFYVGLSAVLESAVSLLERMSLFVEERYGHDAPNLSSLTTVLGEVYALVSKFLEEKIKAEPVKKTPVEAALISGTNTELQQASIGDELVTFNESLIANLRNNADGSAALSQVDPLGQLTDAYSLVVRSAQHFFDADPHSPVPYLVCAGLRFGETRMQSESPASGFAVGPSAQIRQTMRSLASRGLWAELLRASLPVLAAECSRAWLDMHRYIWKAAQETGATALSDAVVGTVKSLLDVRPELRNWTLEDDTGAANPETQQWLDNVVRASRS